MTAPGDPSTAREAPPLQLLVIAPPGGTELQLALWGRPGLALQQRIAQPPTPAQGGAVSPELPAAISAALSALAHAEPGTPLQLVLDATTQPWAWERCLLGGRPLATLFAVQRVRLASAADDAEAGTDAAPTGDDVRQISILSVDLVGSTALMHALGDEEYSERLTHYHRRVAQVARAHAGLADDPQGDDGFMCYFGYPVASEDAAAMALRAALTLSGSVDDLGLSLRIGVSTGRVVIRNGQPVGAAVHLAARLQQAAPPGVVLCGEATQRLAAERFSFVRVDPPPRFKGFEEAGTVWRVVKEKPVLGTERFDDRSDLTPFLGRQAELAQLLAHWRQAAAGQRRTVLLHGEAGIGKSRLVRELRHALAADGVRILECRCAPELSASPFQPLIDLLRRQLGVRSADAPATQLARLRALPLITGPQGETALALLGTLLRLPAQVLPPLPAGSAERHRQQTMALVLRIADALAAEAPVCLIVEDLQWADPSTRALVEQLAAGTPTARMLLLLTLRGGPAEAAAAGFAVPTLRLGGLDAQAARELLQRASGGRLDDAALAQWLAERADGVPLFIEESARMAATLAAERPGDDLARLLQDAVPATLADLLTARLDQLPQAKRAAQVGGALGRVFPQDLIEAVNAHASSPIRLPALQALLEALVGAGLLVVDEHGSAQAPVRSFAFRHALLRDAAHQSMLERDRRRLHAAIAAVLLQHFSALCDSQPELLARHQEQAGLWAEALASWERAARQAARRSAHHEALAHLQHALALLAAPPPTLEPAARGPLPATALRLAVLHTALLIATQGYGARQLEAVYADALALARAQGDAGALAKLLPGLQGYHFMRGDFARAQQVAQQIRAGLGDAPEPLARLQADWAQAHILFHQGRLPAAVQITDQCIATYRVLAPRAVTLQDPGVLCLGYSAWALWEMGQADTALARAREAVALAERLQHPFSQGQALGFLAVVHLLRDEPAPGLLAARRALEVCEAGGFVQWLAHARVLHGRLQLALGEREAGLAEMAAGDAQWAATGAVVTRPFYAALRAEGLLACGRPHEALALLQAAQALVRRFGERFWQPELQRLEAQALAEGGHDPAEALRAAEAALALARELALPGLAARAEATRARLAGGPVGGPVGGLVGGPSGGTASGPVAGPVDAAARR